MVSLEWMLISDTELWTFNRQLFVFRSRPSLGLRLWGGTLAELQREQPCQPVPASLFSSFPCSCLLLLVSAKTWAEGKEPFLSGK